MIRAGTLLALAALAACTRPASVPPAQAERVVGVPALVGTAPAARRVVVSTERGESLEVTGALAPEIGALSGARVEVHGRRGPRRTLAASDYDVLSVDGRPAILGVVERAPDGALHLRARDGRLLRIRNPPPAFRPGMRVWVQGPGEITVQAYGVVRQ
jgi:hypothetical protein